MTPEAFVSSLRKAAGRLDLTASDLALWFGRPRPTLCVWLTRGTPRRGKVLDECARRLTLLQGSADLPVPFEVTMRLRPAYIKAALRHADNARLPAGNSAGEGRLLRSRR
jgi:hypothetical protein